MVNTKVTVRCEYCTVTTTLEETFNLDFEKPYTLKKCRGCYRINQKSKILKIELVEVDN